MARTLVRILALMLLAGGLVQACAPEPPPVTRGAVATPRAAPPVPAGRLRIGLMLPLSGPQAGLGRALAQAAQAAFLEQAGERLELIQADSGGTADGASRAAAQLLAEGAAIVVGPLLAAELRAAAPSLRGAGVPVIALSSDIGAAEPGVFVTGLLPIDQVRAGLSFLRNAGTERLAVLGLDDPSGRAFAEAARAVGGELGLEVSRVALYAPGVGPSAALAEVSRPDLSRRGQPGFGAASPAALAFDTLLLPDAGSRLRQVAAALAAGGLDATAVRLLGPALWVAESDLGSEPALVGALFPAPDEAAWDRLASRLGLAFASRPPRLSLIAYDAMAVAVAVARSVGAAPVPVESLLAAGGFTGATGRLRLLENGQSQRQLRLYQVTPEGVRDLGLAPFDPPLVGLSVAAPQG